MENLTLEERQRLTAEDKSRGEIIHKNWMAADAPSKDSLGKWMGIAARRVEILLLDVG